MKEDYNDNSKTFAEYDFKRILLTQYQTYSQICNEWIVIRSTHKGRYRERTHKQLAMRGYLDIYNNINNPQTLSKISQTKREFLDKYSGLGAAEINHVIAYKLNKIINEIMNKYGITNLSNTSEGEV